MGRIGKFFNNTINGVKKWATKIWNFGNNVVSKVGHVLKPVASIAEKVGGVMSALPGKAGLIGTALAKGGSVVRNITSLLPDSTAKTKINPTTRQKPVV